MIKVLFICHGNICRSTMAQFVFAEMVNKAGMEAMFAIDSAATHTDEIGSPPHWGVRQKLKEVGVPVLPHRARLITKADYRDWDLLIGMDGYNLRDMYRVFGGDPEGKCSLLLSHAGRSGSIADPWYTGDFDATYRDVVEGCTALLNQYRKRDDQ